MRARVRVQVQVLMVHSCTRERVPAAVTVCSAAVCMHGCACACLSPLQSFPGDKSRENN